MDRKRFFYFVSLVLLLETYRGIYGEDKIIHYKSDTDKSEFVFHGKGATLFCNVRNKNPDKVKKVQWEFNNTRIATRKKYTSIEKYTDFTDKIDIPSKDPFIMNIKSMSISMTGKYKCTVTYEDDKAESSEFFLHVIMDACDDSGWKFSLNKATCEETVSMTCVGVYPRPQPKCLLISSEPEQQSVFLHTSSLPNNTFKISILSKHSKKEFENATDLTLSCKFQLEGTSYEFGVTRKMFGERGCPVYPDAGNGYVNDSNIVNTCWDHAANGSSLTYQCDNDKVKLLTCLNDFWVDETGSTIITDRSYCDGGNMEMMSKFSILMAVLMLYYYY